MKRYLKLLWAVPLTFALFFLVMSIVPRSVPFPELFVLGNDRSIEIKVPTPKHVFYIAQYAPIEDEYNSLISKLSVRVFDSDMQEVPVERVDRFFYTGKAKYVGKSQEETVHGGSVFKLPKNVEYPFTGRLESNVAELNGVFWAESTGSFMPVSLTFVGLLLFSGAFVYFFFLRRRKGG